MPARITIAQARKLGIELPPTAKKAAKATAKTAAKATFLAMCAAYGLPTPTPEYRFCERRWRMDFAFVSEKVYVEVDGGAWTGGRHTRGKGFIDDQTKRNRAVALGWRPIHCTPADVKSGAIFATLKGVLGCVKKS